MYDSIVLSIIKMKQMAIIALPHKQFIKEMWKSHIYTLKNIHGGD